MFVYLKNNEIVFESAMFLDTVDYDTLVYITQAGSYLENNGVWEDFDIGSLGKEVVYTVDTSHKQSYFQTQVSKLTYTIPLCDEDILSVMESDKTLQQKNDDLYIINEHKTTYEKLVEMYTYLSENN